MAASGKRYVFGTLLLCAATLMYLTCLLSLGALCLWIGAGLLHGFPPRGNGVDYIVMQLLMVASVAFGACGLFATYLGRRLRAS